MAYEKEKKTAVALEYTPGEQAPISMSAISPE